MNFFPILPFSGCCQMVGSILRILKCFCYSSAIYYMERLFGKKVLLWKKCYCVVKTFTGICKLHCHPILWWIHMKKVLLCSKTFYLKYITVSWFCQWWKTVVLHRITTKYLSSLRESLTIDRQKLVQTYLFYVNWKTSSDNLYKFATLPVYKIHKLALNNIRFWWSE